MAITNIELYEALKRDLNEEAARRIAEVVPAAADLSTKGDLESATSALKADVNEVNLSVARLEAKIEAVQASTLRWMIGMFIPVWAGTWATVVAVVLKS